ncbi:hypothetical protein DAI22_08g080150 [Oryza sativa Japonica Group]|nr:hypothetical protein DAI22_08g080150 [Oryza sativa Japonica Group]
MPKGFKKMLETFPLSLICMSYLNETNLCSTPDLAKYCSTQVQLKLLVVRFEHPCCIIFASLQHCYFLQQILK